MKAALLSTLLIPVAFAQTALDCSRARYCEMREQTVSATGRFTVDDVHNGSITVRGSNRADVLVRMRVETDAHSDREAKDLFGRIHTHVTAGRFSVDGPGLPNNPIDWLFGTSWSVSVEVLMPNKTDLVLATHNGSIRADDVGGRVQAGTHNGAIQLTNVTGDVRFNTHNGGVRLTRIGGGVDGSSHNGGMEIELSGAGAVTRSVRVDSHNGGIEIALPASYSAHVSADTHNGGVRSDFPMNVASRREDSHREFNIGGGGGTVRISTHNGGIRIRRL
jgi:hypothetical protein